MQASKFFIATLKEAPSEAELVSHQLLLRAGMISQLSSGIYTYLPLGLRVLRRIENIIREEMDAAGALELLLPVVQPAELWQETGRWDGMGPELLRIHDRHGRKFALQATAEEAITAITRRDIKSYKQLPLNLYQIQTKFRDERRPRFGLMRGREFSMKDAYSFDHNVDGLKASYATMRKAYTNIFTRLQLNFRIVIADNGSIGGLASEEFHLIAQAGEDAIAYCPDSDYCANIEAAPVCIDYENHVLLPPEDAIEHCYTPGITTCEAIAAHFAQPLHKVLKTMAFVDERDEGLQTLFLVVLRGDHYLNEIKLAKYLGHSAFRLASREEIITHFACEPGYLGPRKIMARIIADQNASVMHDFICGANDTNYHYRSVHWHRDLPLPEVADLRNVVKGDPSPDGRGTLEICRGIEIGHIFMLGTTYSEKMQAHFLDEAGTKKPLVMGCYGIGVSRLLAAIIEQHHDERGMIWPQSIAPFACVLLPIAYHRNAKVREVTDKIYKELQRANVAVMLDDRDERPGVMFADWELIGIPLRFVISERGLQQSCVEYQYRHEQDAKTCALDDIQRIALSPSL